MERSPIKRLRREQVEVRQRQTRRRRWLIIAGATVVVLGLIVFFVLPPLVRTQLQKRLAAELEREVAVGPVRLNPFALSATIRDFRVQDRDGQTLVGWARLYANLQVSSLWRGAWVLRRVELDQPRGRIVIHADGSLNVSDLIEKFGRRDDASPSEPARPVRIDQLAIRAGGVDFQDHAQETPFVTSLGPLDLTLQRFETADGDDAPYTFEGASGFGERFSWRGTINAAPLRSTGEFAVENIAVSNYGTYHEPRLAGELNDGVVSLRGHYTLDLTPGARRVELSNGGVRIERLRVSLPGAATPAVSLPEIVVTGLEARLSPLFVRVGDVSVVGGEVRGTRRADGSIDLAELGPVASSTAPASTPATATPLDFHLGKLSVSDVAFVWRDDATPRPAEVQGRVQLFEVRDFALAGTTLADLVARLAVDPAGEIQLEGKFGMNPLRLVADTTLQAIPLAVASPYVESQANVRLVDGTLSLLGGLEAEWADRAGSPQVTWQGALTVKNLATTDSAGEALAGFEEFAARDLGLSGLSPLAVTIGELELVRPSARVLVAADGQVNLANLSRPATEEADPPAAETPETNNGERPSITITRTRVTGGAFMFEDRSVDPVVRTGVSELTLQLGSFSSTETKPAPLTLDARVLGTGRLEVRGLVHLLNPQATSEFAVKAGEIDLKPVGPYIAKFAGYQLQDGDLGVDLDYHIAQRQLRSTNVVVLDKFTLGAPSGSEEATSLPVPLAVALLKDRAGKIEIDLPIEGSLDDPSFRIGRVAWRMIGNLLTRAATSPFSLLAKLVPGGAEVDLSSVMFAPGATELAATELEKLGLVARALQERPALQVAIAAGSDPAVDGPALQLQRAEQAIRQRIWEARRSAGSSTDAVETVEPTMEEQETALWAWFAETFPEEARAALVASAPAAGSAEAPATAVPPPAAADAGEAEASAERPGPVRRFFRALGFGRTVAPPRPTETSATTAPALPASPARDAAPFEAGRPEPDWAKLEQRLIDSFAIDPAELASLGVARADHVRRQLVERGVDAARLSVAGTEVAGTKAALELR